MSGFTILSDGVSQYFWSLPKFVVALYAGSQSFSFHFLFPFCPPSYLYGSRFHLFQIGILFSSLILSYKFSPFCIRSPTSYSPFNDHERTDDCWHWVKSWFTSWRWGQPCRQWNFLQLWSLCIASNYVLICNMYHCQNFKNFVWLFFKWR